MPIFYLMENLMKLRSIEIGKSVATVASIISVIISIVFYAASLDKRISLIEENQPDVEKRLDTLREDVNTINGYQDTEINQFHNDIYRQLDEMNARVEKIYSILLDAKKNEAI